MFARQTKVVPSKREQETFNQRKVHKISFWTTSRNSKQEAEVICNTAQNIQVKEWFTVGELLMGQILVLVNPSFPNKAADTMVQPSDPNRTYFVQMNLTCHSSIH